MEFMEFFFFDVLSSDFAVLVFRRCKDKGIPRPIPNIFSEKAVG
jgi:hypothetical protein